MSNKIIDIDYQTIVNKLQELKESIPLIDVDLDSSLDSKSYEFLEFIDRTIKLAHEIDIANSINTARSIEQLLNDAKPLFDTIIDKYSDTNKLISYYEDLLKEHFKNIQSKLSSMQDNMVDFDLTLATLKLNLLLEDLSAINKNTTDNSKDILEQFANELIEKFEDNDNEITSDALDLTIEKVFKEHDNEIHNKLSEVFSKVSSNIGANVKAKINAKYNLVFKNTIIRHFDPKKRNAFQRGLAKIKRRVGLLATPITIISKFSKHVKKNLKANIKRQQVKMAVKSNLEMFAKYGLAGVIVKNIIPVFRRKKEEENKKEEKKENKQSHLDKFLTTSNKDIFLKHGIAGLLVKKVLKIFHKPKLEVDDDKISKKDNKKKEEKKQSRIDKFLTTSNRDVLLKHGVTGLLAKQVLKIFHKPKIEIDNKLSKKDNKKEEKNKKKENKKEEKKQSHLDKFLKTSNKDIFLKHGVAGLLVKQTLKIFHKPKLKTNDDKTSKKDDKKEKKQSHLDKFLTTSNKDIFLKHGIEGLLVKQVLKIFHKPKLEVKLEVDDDKNSTPVIRKYDFNPFVVSDRRTLKSIPRMIGKVFEFAQIVKTNIKNYFEIKEDIIEEYNGVKDTKKKGLFSFLKKDEKKEAKVKSGGGLLSLILGPLLRRALRPITKFLAKTMKNIAIKSGRWVVGGIRYAYDSLRYGTAYAKHMKIVRTRALHIADIRKARLAKEAAKVGKTATKTSLRSAGKTTTILAFVTDAVIGTIEAQDKKLMGQVFGMAQSEIGVQQKTSYILSSIIAGNESIFDTDWSSGTSIASGVLGTLGTTVKWAMTGALVVGAIAGGATIYIGGLGAIPGAVAGAIVGAVLGLAVALIGTSRIARIYNWTCNTIKKLWHGYWRFYMFILKKSIELYFTILQDIWSGIKWTVKKIVSIIEWPFKKIASWFKKSKKAKVVLETKIKKLDMQKLLTNEQKALKNEKENKQLEVFDSLNNGITRVDRLAHELIELMKNMRNVPVVANEEDLTLQDLQQAIINGRQDELKQLAVAANRNKPKSVLQNAKEHWDNESELEEFRRWQAAQGFA